MQQRNIRLCIAYDGTNFCGWQRQQNGPSIQGTLEEKLRIITTAQVVVHGAGRTDAGVHAQGMVAHFSTGATMPVAAFAKALNSMLPKDIRILEAEEAAPDFHARFSAKGKTYCYDFFTELSDKYPNFTFHLCLPRPKEEDNWTGSVGHVHNVLYQEYLKDHEAPEDIQYYTCGPPVMTKSLITMLTELGVEEDSIYMDDFGG
ncbi:MAG: hypothetical protein D3914_02555 [Candidatus Electrothrix sp. LOE2]|nr:hypothetical protein [Candidatus Electrothrix sp. LOE2]